jgi:hypothetical protein
LLVALPKMATGDHAGLTGGNGRGEKASKGGAEYTTSPPVTVRTDSIPVICWSGTDR